MNIKHYPSILFFSLLPLCVWAQDRPIKPTITGKIVEHISQQPIEWASVWSYEAGNHRVLKVVYAKSDGSFAWQAPKAGTYKLVFKALGCISDSLVVELAADTQVGMIKLFPDDVSRTLEAASVTAEQPLMVNMIDRYVYDVSRDPDAKRKKMTEMIEKIPNVNALTADGRLEYGGVRFEQIFIDGERHEMINVGLQFPMRMIRGDVMDKIELILPGSPQYDNSGPILNIITSRPLPNGYAAEVKGEAATNNNYVGNVDVVSKIRDKVVLRFGYGINYGSSPKLNSNTLRENYASDGTTASSLESVTQSWTDRLSHAIRLRGSTKLFARNLTFGVSTGSLAKPCVKLQDCIFATKTCYQVKSY